MKPDPIMTPSDIRALQRTILISAALEGGIANPNHVPQDAKHRVAAAICYADEVERQEIERNDTRVK